MILQAKNIYGINKVTNCYPGYSFVVYGWVYDLFSIFILRCYFVCYLSEFILVQIQDKNRRAGVIEDCVASVLHPINTFRQKMF